MVRPSSQNPPENELPPPGSEPYLEILSDLWVDLTWLEQKAKHAAEAVEAFQESLPEEES